MGVRQSVGQGLIRASTMSVLSLLMIASCSAPTPAGILQIQVSLGGRVPFPGKSFTLGVVRDRSIIQKLKVPHPGGRFHVTLPEGRYELGIWLPGAPNSIAYIGCTTYASVYAGRSSPAQVNCVWY